MLKISFPSWLIEICLLQLSSPLELKNIVLLEPGDLSFSGTKSLAQFNVKSYNFKVLENGSRVHVEIYLQRIFYYHLTNTYIPTISLLFIAEVTLYFEESQTELSVGLSLTIMLVMYTMYQSINEPLTKTAYLKMIDYWLLFCLLFPFVIFMIEIYWLLSKKKTETYSMTNKGWFSSGLVKKIQTREVIQYLVPSLTCLFIGLYVMTAAILYNGYIYNF